MDSSDGASSPASARVDRGVIVPESSCSGREETRSWGGSAPPGDVAGDDVADVGADPECVESGADKADDVAETDAEPAVETGPVLLVDPAGLLERSDCGGSTSSALAAGAGAGAPGRPSPSPAVDAAAAEGVAEDAGAASGVAAAEVVAVVGVPVDVGAVEVAAVEVGDDAALALPTLPPV